MKDSVEFEEDEFCVLGLVLCPVLALIRSIREWTCWTGVLRCPAGALMSMSNKMLWACVAAGLDRNGQK